ncbi:hypothetical protein [Planococcus alpniumensis]|uniref:hypothetical protein n=1 Tax=Planococcus alpniumensis TaxID=2708345 RepID=UPI001B8C2496|nr:hypothetical protein [Planococcus sp. MSAK28401]
MIRGNKFFAKENKGKIAVAIAVIILIPVIIGLLLNIPLGGYTIGSEDSWVGFHGGYIGGITGGIVAYFIAKLQIDTMRAEQEKVFNDNYLRTFLKIENYLEKTESLLNGHESAVNKMLKHILSEEDASSEDNPSTKRAQLRSSETSLQELNETSLKIESFEKVLKEIPAEYIPIEVFKDFINLIEMLEKLKKDVQRFVSRGNEILTLRSPALTGEGVNARASATTEQHIIKDRNQELLQDFFKYQKAIKKHYSTEAKVKQVINK